MTSLQQKPCRERLRAILRCEIIDDVLHIPLGHRCAHRLDHLVHGRFPTLAIENRRIHLDIVEAVAHRAICLDQTLAGGVCQMKLAFSREARRRQKRKNQKCSHAIYLYVASISTRWTTLLW